MTNLVNYVYPYTKRFVSYPNVWGKKINALEKIKEVISNENITEDSSLKKKKLKHNNLEERFYTSNEAEGIKAIGRHKGYTSNNSDNISLQIIPLFLMNNDTKNIERQTFKSFIVNSNFTETTISKEIKLDESFWKKQAVNYELEFPDTEVTTELVDDEPENSSLPSVTREKFSFFQFYSTHKDPKKKSEMKNYSKLKSYTESARIAEKNTKKLTSMKNSLFSKKFKNQKSTSTLPIQKMAFNSNNNSNNVEYIQNKKLRDRFYKNLLKEKLILDLQNSNSSADNCDDDTTGDETTQETRYNNDCNTVNYDCTDIMDTVIEEEDGSCTPKLQSTSSTCDNKSDGPVPLVMKVSVPVILSIGQSRRKNSPFIIASISLGDGTVVYKPKITSICNKKQISKIKINIPLNLVLKPCSVHASEYNLDKIEVAAFNGTNI